MEMGDKSKAKEVFKQLSEIKAIFEEENKHIFNEFGIELRKANMSDEALSNYLKAITISPQDEHLHFNIARIYYDKEEWDNALDWLHKALEINPHFIDAQKFEALILKKMQELGITPSEKKAAVPGKSQNNEEGRIGDEVEDLAAQVDAAVPQQLQKK
jgi:tetratricopeptide (TPR) repeat protein